MVAQRTAGEPAALSAPQPIPRERRRAGTERQHGGEEQPATLLKLRGGARRRGFIVRDRRLQGGIGNRTQRGRGVRDGRGFHQRLRRRSLRAARSYLRVQPVKVLLHQGTLPLQFVQLRIHGAKLRRREWGGKCGPNKRRTLWVRLEESGGQSP